MSGISGGVNGAQDPRRRSESRAMSERAQPQGGPGAGSARGTDPAAPVAEQPPVTRGSYRRRHIVIPTLVIMLLAAAAVGYWYFEILGVIATDDAYVDGNSVSVSSKMLGRITELTVDEGDTVQQGQLIVQLDDSDLRAQEAHAQAGLDYARENVDLAAVQLQQAEDDYARATIQLQGKVITQEQFDHARTALNRAQVLNRIAAAQVNTARAELGLIRTQIANTQIAAPLTGVVARRWVLAGDVVQAGQAMLSIYDLSDLWVTANLEETKIAAIHVHDSVDITLDAHPGRRFAGEITMIGAAAASEFSLIPPNNASGNFTKVTQRIPIRISLGAADGDPLLVPGMSAEIRVRPPR
jgi:membrane fusion protein (multidrug efflux system)